jgi:hypothetical protein
MKFMKSRKHFLREIKIRSEGNFSEEFVVGALRVHDRLEFIIYKTYVL